MSAPGPLTSYGFLQACSTSCWQMWGGSFGYWPSLEKMDYSQKATKSHVTKIVDLWVVWLGLRHTWGEYCHLSNTAQSGFMKKNEGT